MIVPLGKKEQEEKAKKEKPNGLQCVLLPVFGVLSIISPHRARSAHLAICWRVSFFYLQFFPSSHHTVLALLI